MFRTYLLFAAVVIVLSFSELSEVLLYLLYDVDLEDPVEFAAVKAETGTATMQVVANRTSNDGELL